MIPNIAFVWISGIQMAHGVQVTYKISSNAHTNNMGYQKMSCSISKQRIKKCP
jgi:hypothetical protein